MPTMPMKKYLLISMLSFPLMASAWNVSTEPSPKGALIEEYTGIHCPNCPDGHKMAAMLSTLHPDQVYPVAIHAGYYAQPGRDEPDFRTQVGEALNDYFEVSFYPAGIVNRRSYKEQTVLGRSYWGSACRQSIRETSPVNLWSSASYDPATRLLTVEVEGYLTSGMEDPRLNLYLLQSEILGPQSGGLLGNDYPHRHALRARLTDNDLGDAVEVKTQGEYFSRSFEYTLPEEITGVATDPVNMELVAFVTEGEGEVCAVSECRPDTSDLPQTFSAGYVASPLFITKNYAFDFFEVVLENHGGEALTSADFDIQINSKPYECRWEGEIPGHTNEIVKIPLNGALKDTYDEESTSYVIRLTKVNGKEVEASSLRGTIQEVAEYPAEMIVKIKTDNDASDNTWRILDEDGNVVYDFGPYPDGVVTEAEEHVELEPGKIYCLEIFDCWGDGIINPLGNVKLLNNDGKQLVQYKEVREYGLRQFFRALDISSVDDLSAATEVVKEEIFDLTGAALSEPVSGVYLLRYTYSDGSIKVEKRYNP